MSMPVSPPYKVMVVDDHPVVRAGIAAVLSRDPDFVVVGEAGSEQEVFDKTRDLAPDLAIIDLSLSTTSGFLFFRQLLQTCPNMRLLVLSMHDEQVYAEKVLQAGAHGYLMKGETTSAMIEAARTVLGGHLYVSSRMRDLMLKGVARGAAHQPRHGPSGLSRTELIVLQMIGAGSSGQEIAKRLNRSLKTIDTHRANIKRKLDLPHNSALVRYAIQFVQQNP